MPVKSAGPRCGKLLKSGNLCDKRCDHPSGHRGPIDGRRLAREWYQANPERMIWLGAKGRAKSKGVPFTLAFEEMPPVPDACPILGIPLFRSEGSPTDNSPSLDRIIPELGYASGNVQWISHRANTIKRDATPAELMMVAQYMTKLGVTDG